MSIEGPADSVSVLERRIDRGSHEFVVKNYSLFKGTGKNNAIESAIFSAGGYKWTIMFYPNGRSDDFPSYKDGNSSLAICLKSKTCSTSPVQCIVEQLGILDQSGKSNHRCFTSAQVASFQSNRRVHGYPNFIQTKILESSNKYLKDDCLRIRATIGVITSKLQVPPPFGKEDRFCSKIGLKKSFLGMFRPRSLGYTKLKKL